MPSTDSENSFNKASTSMETLPMETDQENDVKGADAKKAKGNTHYAAKEYKDAIQLYTEAIEMNPRNCSYYSNRCAAFMMLDNYKKALEDAQTSIRIDPTFAKGHLREGKCHIALGNPQAALLSLQKAKDFDQSSGAIMNEFLEWSSSLPPTSYELIDKMRQLATDGMNKIMEAIGQEIEKDFKERREREERGKMPIDRSFLDKSGKINSNNKKKWIRCRDGKYRNVSEFENVS